MGLKSILIILAMVFAGYLIFISFSDKIFFAEGDSMKPTFGECVIVFVDKNVNPFDINEEDIVLVNLVGLDNKITDYDIIAHRVVINNNETRTIATRGDNDNIYNYTTQVDGFFDYDRILGNVDNYYNLPVFFCNIRNFPKNFLI